ncbi:MAG TPA: isoamylase early set domain-containing protein [Gemmatimonadaceae bacterium]
MLDDHERRIDQIARELKRPERVSSSFDVRVMRAVRELPRHARLTLWSRLTTPRRITVTPLSWGLLAASLLVFAVAGTRAVLVEESTNPAKPITTALFATPAKKQTPQAVQFVLVAPDAKKVAVVGDFNGWDPKHASYQAQHRGGGVWSVTASVPVGHHRYSFVVDDSLWVADPIAPRAVDNDFGVTNSTLVVQAAQE